MDSKDYQYLEVVRTKRRYEDTLLLNKGVVGCGGGLDKEGKPNFAKLELLNENNEIFVCQPISAELDYGLDSMPAGWWTVVNLKPLSLTPARLTIQNNSNSEDLGKNGNLSATENSLSNEKVKINIDHDTGAIVELSVNEINNGNN